MTNSAPADRIVRLIREAADQSDRGRKDGPQIFVQGDGNIVGDMISFNSAQPPRTLTRASRKVLRASAISFIRHACRRSGDPLLHHAFAIDEFGTADLERLDETQLERVRGWCAAQIENKD